MSGHDSSHDCDAKLSSITLHDVARAAGVSIKTVSRVLNNERYVREDKRQRVQAAIERLNYRPNMAARSLSGTKSYLLAFLAPSGAVAYVDQLLRGVLTSSQQAGYHLVVEFYDPTADDLVAKVQALCASTRLDGAVLAPGICDSPDVIALLDGLGIAHVSISPREALASRYIYIDDVLAAHDMTCHLLALGHRRIAFIGHRPGWRFAERRLEGFRLAMGYAGLHVPPELIVNGTFTFLSGQECARALLSAETRPTALFAVNDDMAIGAITAAYALGLSIPRDLSIAGFDDSPAALICWPQLTTVRQPIAAMAATAAECVLQPQGGSVGQAGICLPFDVVVRGTTGKPAAEEFGSSAS
jgi:LacI family transcriptional regulator